MLAWSVPMFTGFAHFYGAVERERNNSARLCLDRVAPLYKGGSRDALGRRRMVLPPVV